MASINRWSNFSVEINYERRQISVLDAAGHEMHKQIFALVLLASIGLGTAAAQESHAFERIYLSVNKELFMPRQCEFHSS
jgi:hypothetical protein